MTHITLYDYLLLPFYLLLIYSCAFWLRKKFYPQGHPWRSYFIPGLTVKIVGAIFIGMVYEYYYFAGDTFGYFTQAQIINSAIDTYPDTWYRLITHNPDPSNVTDSYYISQFIYPPNDTAAWTLSSIACAIGLFTFTKYLLIAVCFATISFTGIWALFRTFALQYPKQVKNIALATLFVPSVVIWGSGLFKDTLCLMAIGWLCYCTYKLMEKRKIRIRYIGIIALSSILLYFIKSYILIALMPFLLWKAFLVYQRSLISPFKRKLVMVGFVAIVLFAAYKTYNKATELFGAYSPEQVAVTAKVTKDYIIRSTEGDDGSTYDLGDFDPTLKGIAKKIIPAVNVSLFRPYLWEVKKPLTFLAAIEALFFLLFTLKVIFMVRFTKTIRHIYEDQNIIFCFLFTLVFAFFVGISSYNFGALSRYRIPFIPFFMIGIILLYDKNKKARK